MTRKVEMVFEERFAAKAAEALSEVKEMFEEVHDGCFDLTQVNDTTWTYVYDEDDYDFDQEYREDLDQFKNDIDWYLNGLYNIPASKWTETLY